MIAEYLPKYRRRQDQRFDDGRREYGDGSFHFPALRLIDEVQQEIEDTGNWSIIEWTKLEALKETLEHIGRIIPEACPAHPKYDPAHPPRRLCERCWFIYTVRQIQRDVMGLT
jgi:hypothetical protein